MGWFLSTCKKKKTTRHRYQGETPRQWDPQRTLQGLKFLGATAALAALVGGWRYSERFLTDYVAARHTTPISAERVGLAGTALWNTCRLNVYRAGKIAFV